ncbi:MAG: hypothetical protein QM765_10075 [Myxococcales bacterium]
MLSMILAAALTAAPPAPVVVREHGLAVTAPEGWTVSKEGTTWVFSPPSKGTASLRVDLFEKEKRGEAADCMNQIVEKLAAAAGETKAAFTSTTIDGQPAALHTSVDKRRQKVRQLSGCNGKSYFLIDWVDVGASAKHEDAFAMLLTQIKYEAAAAAPGKAQAKAAKKEDGSAAVDPLAPLAGKAEEKKE